MHRLEATDKMLSIIIPTKNRTKELVRVVRIMDRYEADFEIVVQDNSEQSSLRQLETYSHVRYYHNRDQLSMSENFDEGIKHSRGDYVICIGDDDCVCDNIFEAVSYMECHYIETCNYPQCYFLWENVKRKKPEEWQLRRIHREPETLWREIDAIRGLETVCRTSNFSLNRLPGVYHGIVSRAALERVYGLTGSYFPSASSDISNIVALCVTAKRCVYVNRTLSVAGSCASSAGGLGATKLHVRELSDVPWLPKDIETIWDARVPRIWTAETIWMFSMIDALKKCGHGEIADKIKWSVFYASFIYRHRELLNRLNVGQLIRGCYGIPRFALNRLAARKADRGMEACDIRTIEDAVSTIAREFAL